MKEKIFFLKCKHTSGSTNPSVDENNIITKLKKTLGLLNTNYLIHMIMKDEKNNKALNCESRGLVNKERRCAFLTHLL